MPKKRLSQRTGRMRVKQFATQADADVWTKTLGAWKRREAPEETVVAARKAFRVQLSKRIRAMTPAGVRQTDSARLIREDRDRR